MNSNNTPFSEEQLDAITKLINPLNELQIAWISGYLAGLNNQKLQVKELANVEPEPTDHAIHPLTILYGSRTGNGEGLAKVAKKMAIDSGMAVEVKSMEDYKPKDLVNEKHLLVIVSTHGDGEPPFQAKEVYDLDRKSVV